MTTKKINKQEIIEYFENNLLDDWMFELEYNDWEGRWEIYPKNKKEQYSRELTYEQEDYIIESGLEQWRNNGLDNGKNNGLDGEEKI
ncbi:MAG: hypothetical protein KGY67_00355 [Candidatus Thermoplasmatota archaeon]|nr:hypothetical protein [Candidatus Thermoplasmatota archaeon]